MVSWSGTCNLDIRPDPVTLVQVNAGFRSTRLTPQGEMRPSAVFNVGLRRQLLKDALSATIAASDLFATQRQDTRRRGQAGSGRGSNRVSAGLI